MVMCWQIAEYATRLSFLVSLAIAAGQAITQGDIGVAAVNAVPLLLLATVTSLFARRRQVLAEASVTNRTRERAFGNLGRMPARSVQSIPIGALVVGLQRYPQAIGSLVIGHRCASTMMVAGPAIATAFLFTVSWQAGLLLLCLMPVMIVFFVLVGGMISVRAERQERSFSELAGQFADRIRALPTIVANHAVPAQGDVLSARMRLYATHTMGVLAIAFLNSAVIDFFASLSIAILAVFLGLGHLKLVAIPGLSHLELSQTLFILVIAPEFFAPFRRYAEQYHAKAEGLAAAQAMDALLRPATIASPDMNMDIADRRMSLPPVGLVVVTGASGAGKTTLLRRWAGIDEVRDEEPMPDAISWVSTDIFVASGSLRDAVKGDDAVASESTVRAAAGRVGLLSDPLLPGGLDAHIDDGGKNLSGGQRVRIAVARALVSKRTIFADEPTAKLDAVTASIVRSALMEHARDHLVVVATHDEGFSYMTRHRIELRLGEANAKGMAA